jgi:hypothetical protein
MVLVYHATRKGYYKKRVLPVNPFIARTNAVALKDDHRCLLPPSPAQRGKVRKGVFKIFKINELFSCFPPPPRKAIGLPG